MSEAELNIRETSSPSDLDVSLRVIRDSFQTVTGQFGLTEENCPTHPAFMTAGQLEDMKDRGLKLFGLFSRGQQVGFIAVEKNEGGVFWIEKLAVLPSHRHHGFGEKLVGHAIDYIRENGGTKVSLGMIDEHTVLKDWYKGLGFRQTSARRFPHLPFTVCMMEKNLGSTSEDSGH